MQLAVSLSDWTSIVCGVEPAHVPPGYDEACTVEELFWRAQRGGDATTDLDTEAVGARRTLTQLAAEALAALGVPMPRSSGELAADRALLWTLRFAVALGPQGSDRRQRLMKTAIDAVSRWLKQRRAGEGDGLTIGANSLKLALAMLGLIEERRDFEDRCACLAAMHGVGLLEVDEVKDVLAEDLLIWRHESASLALLSARLEQSETEGRASVAGAYVRWQLELRGCAAGVDAGEETTTALAPEAQLEGFLDRIESHLGGDQHRLRVLWRVLPRGLRESAARRLGPPCGLDAHLLMRNQTMREARLALACGLPLPEASDMLGPHDRVVLDAHQHMQHGQPKRGIAALEVVAQESDDPSVCATLGAALVATGDVVAGVRWLEAAFRRGHVSRRDAALLVDAHLSVDDFARAERWAEVAAEGLTHQWPAAKLGETLVAHGQRLVERMVEQGLLEQARGMLHALAAWASPNMLAELDAHVLAVSLALDGESGLHEALQGLGARLRDAARWLASSSPASPLWSELITTLARHVLDRPAESWSYALAACSASLGGDAETAMAAAHAAIQAGRGGAHDADGPRVDDGALRDAADAVAAVHRAFLARADPAGAVPIVAHHMQHLGASAPLLRFLVQWLPTVHPDMAEAWHQGILGLLGPARTTELLLQIGSCPPDQHPSTSEHTAGQAFSDVVGCELPMVERLTRELGRVDLLDWTAAERVTLVVERLQRPDTPPRQAPSLVRGQHALASTPAAVAWRVRRVNKASDAFDGEST